MPLNANNVKTQSKFKDPEILEEGGYPARVQGIVDMGLHPRPAYGDEEKAPAYRIRFTFELSDEFMQDEDGNDMEDKPRWMSNEVNLSSLDTDKGHSTQYYFAIDPNNTKDGDFSKLIGMPCIVNLVVNEGKGKNAGRRFNNIGSVTAIRSKEADKLPDLQNDPVVFNTDEPDLEVFLALPKFVQDKIKEGLEFEGSPLEKLLESHKEGDKGGDTKKASKASEKPAESVSDTTPDEEEDW